MNYGKALLSAGILVLLLLTGCAKSPETLMQEEQEAYRGALVRALDSGQSVILCKAPRRTAWVRLGTSGEEDGETIVMRPEMLVIDGYAALAVQPGTYVLAGAGIVTNGKEDRRIQQEAAPASQKTSGSKTAGPLLGYVQKNRTIHETVSTSRVYGDPVDQGLDYGLGIGLGRGFGGYGSRGYHGGYGRRGYYDGWGPGSWFGTSLHYAPSSYSRPVYQVEERRTHIQDIFTLTLPNRGLAQSGKEPLVASFTIAAGEVLVLETLYLSALSGDFSNMQTRTETGGEAASATSHARSLVFTFESFTENRTPPALGRPVIADRRLVRGLWFTTASPIKTQGRSITREVLGSAGGAAEAYAKGQRERIRLSVQ